MSEGLLGELSTLLKLGAEKAVRTEQERITLELLESLDWIPPSEQRPQAEASQLLGPEDDSGASGQRLGSKMIPANEVLEARYDGLLPLRPRPFRDELLSSWLMRLAFENSERVSRLTFLLTGVDNFWAGDVDRRTSVAALQSMAAATGIAMETLESLTLRVFRGKVFAQEQARGYWRWVRMLGRGKGYNGLSGLMCCPECLAEQPYLRQQWRFGFMTLCTRHKTLLLERCPICQAAYLPHRNEVGYGRDWSVKPQASFPYCHKLRSRPAQCGRG